MAVFVDPGRQGDFTAQIRGLNRQTHQFLMLRDAAIHMINVNHVWLAGFNPCGQDFNPNVPRRDDLHDGAVFRAD